MDEVRNIQKKYIIITGGQLENKGAQAMTFICITEGLKRFTNAIPVVFSNIDYGNDYVKDYRFIIKPYPSDKRVFGHIVSAGAVKISADYKEIFTNAIVMFDISGYKFGSNWGNKKALEYLKMIALAKKYSIPVYILPQSFGPLDFTGRNGNLIRILAGHYLKYPRIIMARENEGKELLEKEYALTNVIKTTDMVLSSRYIDAENIYANGSSTIDEYIRDYAILSGSIAVIPNSKNDLYGDAGKNLDIYKALIDKVLSLGRNVYLIYHSRYDIDICQKIKNMFKDDERVRFIRDELSCIEFESIIGNFNFVIASRYHSIVHSYKKGTPAIILGWATKYCDLAKEMQQEQFCIDVRQDFDISKLLYLVESMDLEYQNESEVIKKRIKLLKHNDVFKLVENDYNVLKTT